ncbi:hypothetical protein BDW22DRAFT_1346477 [Trametopsis cervina]|nr:hypothetical protein BDW22DRAFT_1346477 [Trametopsis cervina]
MDASQLLTESRVVELPLSSGECIREIVITRTVVVTATVSAWPSFVALPLSGFTQVSPGGNPTLQPTNGVGETIYSTTTAAQVGPTNILHVPFSIPPMTPGSTEVPTCTITPTQIGTSSMSSDQLSVSRPVVIALTLLSLFAISVVVTLAALVYRRRKRGIAVINVRGPLDQILDLSPDRRSRPHDLENNPFVPDSPPPDPQPVENRVSSYSDTSSVMTVAPTQSTQSKYISPTRPYFESPNRRSTFTIKTAVSPSIYRASGSSASTRARAFSANNRSFFHITNAVAWQRQIAYKPR